MLAVASQPNNIEHLVANCFDAKVLNVLMHATVEAYALTPNDLKAEIDTHNKVSQRMRKACKEKLSKLAAGLRSASVDEDDAIVAQVAKSDPSDRIALLQTVANWWTDAKQLATRNAAALQATEQQLRNKAEEVVELVKKDLERIGSGPTAMGNADQFEHFARNKNTRSVAAMFKADDAKAQYEAAVQFATKTTTKHIGDSRSLLKTIAIESLGKSY